MTTPRLPTEVLLHELRASLSTMVRQFREEVQAGDGCREEHYEGLAAAESALARTADESGGWERAHSEYQAIRERASHVPGLTAELDELRHENASLRGALKRRRGARVKERPILFSGPMVRAILDGSKTQTRRLVTTATSDAPLPWDDIDLSSPRVYADRGGGINIFAEEGNMYLHVPTLDGETVQRVFARVSRGDRLWVRETFAPRYFDSGRPGYRADWTARAADMAPAPKWKPSIFMRRHESRLTLEVVSVRVERLQEISEEDAKAEGVDCRSDLAWTDAAGSADPYASAVGSGHRAAFRHLWDSINAPRAPWSSNPWVWVVEFKRVEDDNA